MHTNVPPYALKPEQAAAVINYLITETGANISRPGTALFASPSSSVVTVGGDPAVSGMCAYGDFIVAGDNNRRIFAFSEDGTSRDITGSSPLAGREVPSFFEFDGKLLIFGGGAMKVWEGGSGVCSDYATGEAPQPTHVTLMRRYLITNHVNSDKVSYSDPVTHKFDFIDPAGNGTGAGFFTAESSNDPCLAVLTVSGELYCIGSATTDVMYLTAQDADAPFSLAWTITRGLGAKRAFAIVDNTLYMLDSERKVIMLDARTPRAISLQVEQQIKDMTKVSDCVCHRIEFDGRHLLAFAFPTANTALIYDYVTQQWTTWRGWTEADGWVAPPLLAYAYHPKWNRHFCSDWALGKVYELSNEYQDDAGNPRRCERETAPQDFGTDKRKSAETERFRVLRGSTESAVSTSTSYRPRMLVYYNDDNKGWKRSPRTVLLGRLGDGDMFEGELQRCGQFRSRAYRLVAMDPVAITLISMTVTLTTLGS